MARTARTRAAASWKVRMAAKAMVVLVGTGLGAVALHMAGGSEAVRENRERALAAGTCVTTLNPLLNGTLQTRGLKFCEEESSMLYGISFVVMVYTFWALAIVVDEGFVSIIDFIVDDLAIPEDVAGATFMAAGGSAPELFTNMVSTFGLTSTGFGTVVGSAVFNILFVIAMSALFSRPRHEVERRRIARERGKPINEPWVFEPLPLTWWPLFRDASFYVIGLAMLATFFFFDSPFPESNGIFWYESLSLFLLYIVYCVQMAYGDSLKAIVQRIIPCIVPAKQRVEPSSASTASGSSGPQPVVSFQDIEETADASAKGALTRRASKRFSESKLVRRLSSVSTIDPDGGMEEVEMPRMRPSSWRGDPDRADEKLYRVRVFCVWFITLPVTFTLTTVYFNNERLTAIENVVVRRVCATYAFLLSLVWIAFFTYLMVFSGESIFVTLGIPEIVLGYTVLAIGTSIPDLLSSVFVAQYGFGDMAVSSSIGSNIFDILVGLPVPWMLRYFVTGESLPVTTDSIGRSLSIIIGMMLVLVGIIVWQDWKLTRTSAWAMLFSYFAFLLAACLPEVL